MRIFSVLHARMTQAWQQMMMNLTCRELAIFGKSKFGRDGKSPMEPQKGYFEEEKEGKKKEEITKERLEMVH